jgi:hypothetical protein
MEPEKRWLLLFPAVLIYSRRHRFVDEAGHPAMACPSGAAIRCFGTSRRVGRIMA